PDDLIKTWYAEEVKARLQASRGEYGPGDVDELVRQRIDAIVCDPRPKKYERRMADGRMLEFDMRPLPCGGSVRVNRDVTKRQDRLQTILTQITEATENIDDGVAIFSFDERLIFATAGIGLFSLLSPISSCPASRRRSCSARWRKAA
ncbi:MAG: hypothetical protein FJX52_02060, partial [Alphaproteobacteria bacterium]|nr:hypothetical protein [Alphaproteobacteria bacterium]